VIYLLGESQFGDDIALHLLLQVVPLINTLSTKRPMYIKNEQNPREKTFQIDTSMWTGWTRLFEI